jgi:hypothetical protein
MDSHNLRAAWREASVMTAGATGKSTIRSSSVWARWVAGS